MSQHQSVRILQACGLIFALLVFALAVACGSGAAPSSRPESTTAASVSSTTAPVPAALTVVPTAEAEPAAVSPTVSAEPTGSLVIAVEDVGPRTWFHHTTQWPYHQRGFSMGISESLMEFDGVQLNPMLAESWEVTTEGVTFVLRTDVDFHDGWGKLTAEDVVRTYREATIEGGKPAGTAILRTDYTGFEVVDDRTVFMALVTPTIRWDAEHRNWENSTPIISSRVLDEKGQDWASENIIGTGPFKFIDHRGDDFIEMEAINDHWRKTPAFGSVMILDAPEEATRIAMIETGQADITQVSLSNVDQVQDLPGVTLYRGGFGKAQATVTLSGQFYETVDEDGAPLDTSEGKRLLDTSLPWVGDPSDPASMEAARKVRWAFAMAIDREAIVDTILSGQGCAASTVYFSNCHPRHQDRWTIEYNPEMARQYLVEAGYPDGFEFNYFIPSGLAGEIVEVGEALIGMFEAINLRPKVAKEAYQARRPTMLGRTIRDVWVGPYGTGADTAQGGIFDMQNLSHLGVWNAGIEYPESVPAFREGLATTNEEDAWEVITEYLDWQVEQMVSIGTVTWQSPWVAGPKVQEWDFFHHSSWYPRRLEYIVLAP